MKANKKVVAGVLATAMLVQPITAPVAAYAADPAPAAIVAAAENNKQAVGSIVIEEEIAGEVVSFKIQGLLTYSAFKDCDDLRAKICTAVENAGYSVPDNAEITYEATGTNYLSKEDTKQDFVKLEGALNKKYDSEFNTKRYFFKRIAPGTHQIRISGIDKTFTMIFIDVKDAKQQTTITLNENITHSLTFDANGNVDNTGLVAALKEKLIAEGTTEGLDYSIKYKNNFGIWSDNFSDIKAGVYDIQVSFAGNKQYKPATAETKVTFTDARVALNIGLGVTAIPYSHDAAVMEQALRDAIINGSSVDSEQFVIEYLAKPSVNLGPLTPEKWVSLAGETNYPAMGVGQQKIRISHPGNQTYKATEREFDLTVTKANIKVTVQNATIRYGEPVPPMVALNPADPAADVFTIYAGLRNDIKAGVHLELPAKYTAGFGLLGDLNPLNKELNFGQFKDLLTNDVFKRLLGTVLNENEMKALDAVLNAMEKLPGISDGIIISFSKPTQVGVYGVTAVVNSPNYNTSLTSGIGAGSLTILMNDYTAYLLWNQNPPVPAKMTEAEAETYKAAYEDNFQGATLKEKPAEGTEGKELPGNITIGFTGMTNRGEAYVSATFPTKPGKYTITAATIANSNYYAKPISHSFEITQNPAYTVIVNLGQGMQAGDDDDYFIQSQPGQETVVTAKEGYYFPEDYDVETPDGATVTRNSYSQITVSSTPSRNLEFTLADATAKEAADKPEGVAAVDCTNGEDNGKLTGVDSTMEYQKDGDSQWTPIKGEEVTGLAPGSYYVRVAGTETALPSEAVQVTIQSLVSNITLNKESLRLQVGASETLEATVTPDNATDKSVTWTSSNPDIAAVDASGKVTAKAKGEAVISAKTTDGGFEARCTVTVTAAPASSSSSSSSSGFSGKYNYPVVIEPFDHGSAKADKNYAVAGEKVTITITPEAGYDLEDIVVTDQKNKVIAVTKTGNNTYTFTMPEGKVTVSVSTEKASYSLKIVLQIGNKNIVVNGKPFTYDTAPIIDANNRTLVPIRIITEQLGGNVVWNEALQTVTLRMHSNVYAMTIGQIIPGFDTAAIIDENSRTLVPVRYVAEKLGARVDWIAETQQIVITK